MGESGYDRSPYPADRMIDSTAMRVTAVSEVATARPFLQRTIALYEGFARVRDILLRPLVTTMGRLGFTANLTSLTSVVMMVPVVFLARSSPWAATGCIAMSVLADQVDGSIARYLGTRSDRGKLVDMVCDSVAFTMYVIALVLSGLVAPVVAVLLAYTMVLSKIFRVVVHSYSMRSDWLFRSVAGFLPNSVVALMYLVFLVYAASGREFFTVVGSVGAAVLAVDSGLFLWRLLTVVSQPDPASSAGDRMGR